MLESDSPGKYATVKSAPAVENRQECSRWWRNNARMPNSDKNSFSYIRRSAYTTIQLVPSKYCLCSSAYPQTPTAVR